MFKSLEEKAKATVRANLVQTPIGEFFAAGGNQFRTLWVRDFCFAVPGLVAAGHESTVLRQLELILSCIRSDGLLPRGLDEVNPKWRVVAHTALRFFPRLFSPEYKRKPQPEYLGEHRTPAFDSGLLFLSSLQFLEESGVALSPSLSEAWAKILPWYQASVRNGLLFQPPYSDWQDSAAREGFYLHTQLLYYSVAKYCQKRHPSVSLPLGVDEIRKRARDEFPRLSSGLLEECPGTGQAALDSHCRILKREEDFFSHEEKTKLWNSLKASPLWAAAGVPVFPEYGEHEISWTTKAVSLRHYHDGFQWGWLVAESAIAAYSMGDLQQGDELLRKLELWEAAPFLSEVYIQGAPVAKLLYRSECPFTWTAGKVLEALRIRKGAS
jgi:hypothetical protein